ncbi:hypothetical protein [Pectinatus frisingensis]|nr:hypothetical protein [Pectinatus frisingensis]
MYNQESKCTKVDLETAHNAYNEKELQIMRSAAYVEGTLNIPKPKGHRSG